MSPRCPRCEFSYAWHGGTCSHCHFPHPLRRAWDAAADPDWFRRHHPTAPPRSLMLFGCSAVRTAERFLTPNAVEALGEVERAALDGGVVPARLRRMCVRLQEAARLTHPEACPERSAVAALGVLAGAGGQEPELFVAVNLVAEAEGLDLHPVIPEESAPRPAFLNDPARRGIAGHPTRMSAAEREQWAQWSAAQTEASRAVYARVTAMRPAAAKLCDLYRDVVRYPFEPLAFDPAWRTSTAVALARGMVASRDFSPMPILADALQDAGCENPDVLEHCHADWRHVLGCWVIDEVLGM